MLFNINVQYTHNKNTEKREKIIAPKHNFYEILKDLSKLHFSEAEKIFENATKYYGK